MPISLSELNQLNSDAFVAICGPFFEHSSWIAERTFSQRPFSTREVLHRSLCSTLHSATEPEQIALIAAHPDLVGRAALAGTLTAESNREQAAAGLGQLTGDEISLFERYNREYRERFGFPFVICARENKKEAILAAFPLRLKNSREQEIQTALAEIEKIAWLRLCDAISEG
jgi:2-oxo-4-hydroxy-4-carboxy-5-ureidoimidazoline decarboxylase